MNPRMPARQQVNRSAGQKQQNMCRQWQTDAHWPCGSVSAANLALHRSSWPPADGLPSCGVVLLTTRAAGSGLTSFRAHSSLPCPPRTMILLPTRVALQKMGGRASNQASLQPWRQRPASTDDMQLRPQQAVAHHELWPIGEQAQLYRAAGYSCRSTRALTSHEW